jgi:hypothetical protein
MVLTATERKQFPQILPFQGNFQALEMVEGILKKITVEGMDDKDVEIGFTKDQMDFIRVCINVLDEGRRLPYSCLSLIRKCKGENL